LESLPDMENEIIFLGNSLTDGCEWAELFSNPNIKNRGIGGDDTDGILERLEEVILSKPAKIFIMIGTNDLAFGKTVDYIIGNYNKILDRIEVASPETKIYIQSELPTDDAVHFTRKNADLQEINMHLKKIAADRGHEYIDLFSLFFKENKLNTIYSYDGLHVNGDGYLLWKKTIEKYVNE